MVSLARWSGHIGVAVLVAVAHGGSAVACEAAIKAAAIGMGVPAEAALAVGEVESGMYPLAINSDGKTWRPATLAEATRVVRSLYEHHAHNIDVGCMQVSLHYHPTAFRDLRDAFDQKRNTEYGVRLLKDLRGRSGSWGKAVALYHSGKRTAQAEYVQQVADAISERRRRRVAVTQPAAAMTPVTTPPNACEAAVEREAASAEVPLKVARAVARVESGFQPFAINIDGKAYMPVTKEGAEEIVRQRYGGGARNFDVGCMQISLAHHPRAFASLDAAFDPSSNARYGTQLLRALYDQYGSWGRAIVHYHSPLPSRQVAYAGLVMGALRQERFR